LVVSAFANCLLTILPALAKPTHKFIKPLACRRTPLHHQTSVPLTKSSSATASSPCLFLPAAILRDCLKDNPAQVICSRLQSGGPCYSLPLLQKTSFHHVFCCCVSLALAAMLRDCSTYNPPTPQIRFLLKWIAADLQSGGTATSAAAALAGTSGGGSTAAQGERVSGYGLLRAVLGRKLLVPEVYDVMDIVQKQMIT
jgi:U3 small nucleolar RNA-associated protein 20